MTEQTTPRSGVLYSYDSGGRRTTMTATGKPSVAYAYDTPGRVTGIAQGQQQVAMSYDAAGRRSTLALPGGLVQHAGYDAAGQLTALDYRRLGLSVGDVNYDRDANGRVTATWGSLAKTLLPGAMSSAIYDASNRLTARSGVTFAYDQNGNMTRDGATEMGWNTRGQLASMTRNGLTAEFRYDGSGRRSQRSVNGRQTDFHYDGHNVIEESDSASGSATSLTGLGIDEVFSRTRDNETRTALTDALGSLVAETGSDGAVGQAYAYGPFGESTDDQSSYTGRENDGTGLMGYRNRYYNPSLGRFISEDPSGHAGSGTNWYAYVGGDPTNFVDPLGLSALESAIYLVAGAGDTMSFGGSIWARERLGTDRFVDKCSDAYFGGTIAGSTVLSGISAGMATKALTAGTTTQLQGLGASIGGGAFGGLVVSTSNLASSGEITPGQLAVSLGTGAVLGAPAYALGELKNKLAGEIAALTRDGGLGGISSLAGRKDC